MKNLFWVLLLSSLSSLAAADSLSNYRTQAVNQCSTDGEHKDVCACVFDTWSASISPQDEETAIMMMKMVINNQPPEPHQMMQIQPLLMSFQQVGMKCASMNLDEAPQRHQANSGVQLPGVEGRILNEINSGNLSTAELMARLQAADDMRREDRKVRDKQRQEKAQKEQAKRAARIKEYDDEIARIESRSIIGQPVSNFKDAFYMYNELNDTASKAGTECLWSELVKAAGSGPSASLLAYFGALGGGDFDQPPEHRPYLDETGRKGNIYRKSKEYCYKL